MTQMELTEKMGVSFQAVSSWERSETMPDISRLVELGNLFQISVDELLDYQDEVKILAFLAGAAKKFLLEILELCLQICNDPVLFIISGITFFQHSLHR